MGNAPLCGCGCGDAVEWSPSRRRWNKFINRHGRRGVAHSPDAIEKMRVAALARSEAIADHNRSRVWTAESRAKLSASKRDITLAHQFASGKDNPAYKHGEEYRRPSASILIRLRKRLISERGFQCEDCATIPDRSDLLHMHHEDDDTFNNAPSNLKLLCAPCHNKITHGPT